MDSVDQPAVAVLAEVRAANGFVVAEQHLMRRCNICIFGLGKCRAGVVCSYCHADHAVPRRPGKTTRTRRKRKKDAKQRVQQQQEEHADTFGFSQAGEMVSGIATHDTAAEDDTTHDIDATGGTDDVEDCLQSSGSTCWDPADLPSILVHVEAHSSIRRLVVDQHLMGQCKRCIFGPAECRAGLFCLYCHEDHAVHRRPGKTARARRKLKKEASKVVQQHQQDHANISGFSKEDEHIFVATAHDTVATMNDNASYGHENSNVESGSEHASWRTFDGFD